MLHISDEFPNIYIFGANLDAYFYMRKIWTIHMYLYKYEAFF